MCYYRCSPIRSPSKHGGALGLRNLQPCICFFLITAFTSGKAGFSTAYLVVWGSTTAFTLSLCHSFKSKTRTRVFSLLECFPWPLQARYPEGHRRKCYARYISNSIFKTNKHINNTSRSRLVPIPSLFRPCSYHHIRTLCAAEDSRESKT